MTIKTLVERNETSIIYRCDTSVVILDVDLLTLLFGLTAFNTWIRFLPS
jgi:hypothetical protein